MAVKTWKTKDCRRWFPQPPPPPGGGGGQPPPPPPPPGGAEEPKAPQPFEPIPPKGGSPAGAPPKGEEGLYIGGLVTIAGTGDKGRITAIEDDGQYNVSVLSSDEIDKQKALAVKAAGR